MPDTQALSDHRRSINKCRASPSLVDLRRPGHDLDLVVESAYPADPGRAKPNVLGRIGFALLAGRVFLGKLVSTRI